MPTFNNRTIVLHELIGLEAEVENSSDSSQIGIKGTVIDETKNTLLIRTVSGAKRIAKSSSTFMFISGGASFIVDGREICFRSHERLEKSLKFYKRRKP